MRKLLRLAMKGSNNIAQTITITLTKNRVVHVYLTRLLYTYMGKYYIDTFLKIYNSYM